MPNKTPYLDLMNWLINLVAEKVLADIAGTRLHVRHTSIPPQSIGSGSYIKILLNSVLFDSLSEWDPTNHQAVITNTAYYSIAASIGFRPTIGVDKKYIGLLKVNAAYGLMFLTHSSHNDYLSTAAATVLHLSAGDTLQLWVWHNAGIAVDLDFSNSMTFLSIAKLP